MYKEKRLSRSEFVPIRGLNYHVQIWGGSTGAASAQPPLVLLHGWMDVAASYQFMIEAPSSPLTGAASAKPRRPIRAASQTTTGSLTTWPMSIFCSTITQARKPSIWSGTAWAATWR
jgi:hypothetical protein